MIDLLTSVTPFQWLLYGALAAILLATWRYVLGTIGFILCGIGVAITVGAYLLHRVAFHGWKRARDEMAELNNEVRK